MKKRLKRITLILGGIFIVLQLVPVNRAEPPVDAGKKLSPPPEVEAILRASCYDCHSDETRWPWYSYVAPVSWWIANHVNDGRRRLNLSDWADVTQRPGRKPYFVGGQPGTTAQIQCKILGDMESEMQTGQMPLSSYLLIHADARITPEKFKLVTDWFHATIAQLSSAPAAVKGK